MHQFRILIRTRSLNDPDLYYYCYILRTPMKQMSQMLQNLKDSFLKKFAGTFQLFLDKYFGDYLADASQLKLESLVTGVKNLKLNKDFINGVLGSSILTLTSASIGFLLVNKLKLQANGIHFVFQVASKINKEEVVRHFQKKLEIQRREMLKLEQLSKMREEITRKSMAIDQSVDFGKSQQDEGIQYFFRLMETLVGNSSVSLDDIQVVLQFPDNSDIRLKIDSTTLDFQRPEQNQILFIKQVVHNLQIHFQRGTIAKTEQKGIELQTYLDISTKKIRPKFMTHLSSLNVVVSKQQLQQLNKMADHLFLLQKDIDEILAEQTEDLDGLDESIIASIDLKQNIQASMPKVFDYEEINTQTQMFETSQFENDDDYQGLIHQEDQAKVEINMIKIAICENITSFPPVEFKFFPTLNNHFYFYIRKLTVSFKQQYLLIQSQIEEIGFQQIKVNLFQTQNQIPQIQAPEKIGESQIFYSVCNQTSNIPIFQSCMAEAAPQNYEVYPILSLGSREVFEQTMEVVNGSNFAYQHFPQKIVPKRQAVSLKVEIFEADADKFYKINGNIPEIILQIDQSNIKDLLYLLDFLNEEPTGLNQRPSQCVDDQIPDQAVSRLGFEITFPYLILNFKYHKDFASIQVKSLKLSQQTTQPFKTKAETLQPFQHIPEDESPISFTLVTFESIWLLVNDLKLLDVGFTVLKEKQVLPLIIISKQTPKSPEQEGEQKRDLPVRIKRWKLTSHLVIRAAIPSVQIELPRESIETLAQLGSKLLLEIPQKEPEMVEQQQKIRSFIQVAVHKTALRTYRKNSKPEFVVNLTNLLAVQYRHFSVLVLRDLNIIDSQCQIPMLGNMKPRQNLDDHQAAQALLYSCVKQQSQLQILMDKHKNFNNPLVPLDFSNYVVKALLDKQQLQVMIRNLCFRVYDFQFQVDTLSNLGEFLVSTQSNLQRELLLQSAYQGKQNLKQAEIDDQTQLNIDVDLENILVDAFPYVKTTEFYGETIQDVLRYSWTRSLLRLDFNYKSMIQTVTRLEWYLNRNQGASLLCPLLLQVPFNAQHASTEHWSAYIEKSQRQLLFELQFYQVADVQDIIFEITTKKLQVERILVKLKSDVIPTLTEHISHLTQAMKPPEDSHEVQPSRFVYQLKRFIEKNAIQEPIFAEPKLMVRLRIISVVVQLIQGQAYEILSADVDPDEMIIVRQPIGRMQDNGERNQDSIEFILDTIDALIEQENDAFGLQLKINQFTIIDKVASSKYALVLASEAETKEAQISLALVSEPSALCLALGFSNMRVCLSGATLEFLFSMSATAPAILPPVNDEEIEIMQQEMPKQIFHLKKLEILGSAINVTFDSTGIKLNGPLKYLLQISSLKNLKLQLQPVIAAKSGEIENVIEFVIKNIVDSLGSKTQMAVNTLDSMQMLSMVAILTRGIKQLICSPLQQGFVEGTWDGMTEFTKSLAQVALKTIQLPSKTLAKMSSRFGLVAMTQNLETLNEKCKELESQIDPSGQIPRKFLKRYQNNNQ